MEFARTLAESRLQLCIGVVILKAAVQRVPDELVAVLEQIGAELPARSREVVERVQIELSGKLSDYTTQSTWLAGHHGAELVLVVGSGSRITAEGCRKPVDVGIRPLVCCFRMFVLRRSQQIVQQRLYTPNTGY